MWGKRLAETSHACDIIAGDSDGGRFVIEHPPGPHRLEVVSPGYRDYSSEIQVPDGETVPLNVSLMRGRP